MINIFDILAAIFLIVSMFILAMKQSFNPKVKIIGFVFGMIGAVLYIIYGIMTIAIGIIALDSAAFFINIYGITESIKFRKKKNEKKDPFFDVIIPKDFWKDILKSSEFDDEDY